MKSILRCLAISIFLIANNYFVFGQKNQKLSEEDSLMVLKRVFMYDFQKQHFEDIDEPYIEELWFNEKENAKEYFGKAIRLKTAPIQDKMILATYFYQDKDLSKIYFLLNQLETRRDSITIFRIMNSYKIKYSDFDITYDKLKEYCKECDYK